MPSIRHTRGVCALLVAFAFSATLRDAGAFTFSSSTGGGSGGGFQGIPGPPTGHITIGGGNASYETDTSYYKASSLTKVDTGTITFRWGSSGFGGTTLLKAGALEFGNGNLYSRDDGGIVMNDATLIFHLGWGGPSVEDFPADTEVGVYTEVKGSGKVIYAGPVLTIVNSDNSYHGGTFINVESKVALNNDSAFGAATGNLEVNGNLDLNGHDLTVGRLNVFGPTGAIVNDGSQALTLTTRSAVKSLITGRLADGTSSIALVKAGAGVLTMDTADNDYSGGTRLMGGGLVLNHSNALGTGALTIDGVSTIDNGSGAAMTLDHDLVQNWNADFTFKGTNDLNLGAGAVTMDDSRTITVRENVLTVGGVISAPSAEIGLTKTGGGRLIFTNDNTYTGKTMIKTGTLQLGNGGTTGSIGSSLITNASQLVINRSNALTYAGAIKGHGSVVQDGTGTTTLDGENAYTGGTILNHGTLAVGSATALGKGSLTLNSGVLQTAGSQHQINVGGNLSWNSDAVIHLTLTPDLSTSELVAVTGSFIALDSGIFTFDFTPVALPVGENDFIVMTVGKGFGTLTGDDFTFTSSDPLLEGLFEIIGKNLWFKDAYGELPAAAGSDSDTGSFAGGNLFGDNPSPVMPVPEPSTWAMLILGGAIVVFLKRRSVRRA